jgi:hypothetical protein
VGCSPRAALSALTASGIPRPRPTRGRPRRFAESGDHDWLRPRYLDEGASLRELAIEIGCSIRAVRKALARGTGHAPASRTMGQGLVEHRLGRVPSSYRCGGGEHADA